MKFALKKDYCLWVVPPNEGKVRKYRFTVGRILSAVCAGALLGGVFVYVLGDYARLQIIRAENYFTMLKLTSERNHLMDRTQTLKAQLKDLETAQTRAASFQQDVQSRMEQLSKLIDSATALGVFDKNSVSRGKSDRAKEGVGGAEIDCAKGGCKGLIASSSAPTDYFALATDGMGGDKDLVRLLDKLVEALRILPFGLPALGEVSSSFGVRFSPFEHTLKMHEGIDFSQNFGAKIRSAGFGEVVDVGYNGTYGLMIDVKHNDRIISRYAHLSRALVHPGDKVVRGQNIGLAGSSGRSTGPHLHFEVLVDGKPKNPARFLSLAKQLQELM